LCATLVVVNIQLVTGTPRMLYEYNQTGLTVYEFWVLNGGKFSVIEDVLTEEEMPTVIEEEMPTDNIKDKGKDDTEVVEYTA